jgi:hypothetical protein
MSAREPARTPPSSPARIRRASTCTAASSKPRLGRKPVSSSARVGSRYFPASPIQSRETPKDWRSCDVTALRRGKSSLIAAGVLPRLEQEAARGGARWRTCITSPGDAPLTNLARSLAGLDGSHGAEERALGVRRVLNCGRDAAQSLVELLCRDADDHLCVVVDQFEELFAFAKRHSTLEAKLLIDLLLGVQERRTSGLYVILTMRSEFLGACAQFSRREWSQRTSCAPSENRRRSTGARSSASSPSV